MAERCDRLEQEMLVKETSGAVEGGKGPGVRLDRGEI